jgi:hypothetical protein
LFAPLQEKILVVGRALQCSEPFEKASHLTSLYNATQVGRSQRERRRQQKIQSRGLLMLVFNDPAFIRPATDQAGYLLPWVVSQGRSNGFFWKTRLFGCVVKAAYQLMGDRVFSIGDGEVH